MASFETLQERLTALQETTGQLKELIERLATLQFHPGSVPLPTVLNLADSTGSLASAASGDNEPPNVATELSSEISQILREEEDELELLHEEILDLRPGRPGSDTEHRKTRLRDGVQRLDADLKNCRTSFRRAQLSARRSLSAAQKLERELLLASYTAAANTSASASTASLPLQPASPTSATQPHTQLFTARDRRRLREKQANQKSDVLTASSDVTAALRRTHALIAGEVAKSSFATQTLAESTAALKELQQTYEGLDGLLARSRELVGTLLTSQKSDTWYLRTAFHVLLATLAWLVFRRFLYGPLWWLVFFPLRTMWRTTASLSNLGKTGAKVDLGDPRGGAGAGVPAVDDSAVPTMQVPGSKSTDEPHVGEPDSMLEKVGRMVEDSLNAREGELELNKTDEGDVEPNPMKRMWEEEDVQGGVVPARDEL